MLRLMSEIGRNAIRLTLKPVRFRTTATCSKRLEVAKIDVTVVTMANVLPPILRVFFTEEPF